MLNFGGDNNLNLVIIVPVFALVVAVAFLLKFSLRKPAVNKKTQNVKKAQVPNKQKEEKATGDKREKVVKEKKASSSPKKSLEIQTGNEATKSKSNKKQQNQPKQQATINEKLSKKSGAQNKKQQVNNTNTNNALAKANKKQVDIFINKEEEGEWQMVTTKKQKQNKQEENVVVATTSVKTAKKVQKSPEKTNKQPSNKTKKTKEVTEKSDNSTKVVNGEMLAVEEITALNLEPKKIINKSTANSVIPSEITKVTNQNDNVVPGLNSTTSIAATNVEIKTSTAHDTTPVANVAFDELGGKWL